MNQPVSKGYGHTIHKSIEENYCMGKSSKILCVKTKNGRESLCVKMNNNREDAKLQCVGVLQLVEGEEDLPERMNIKIVGRVCVWVRTDSPAAPLPKDHNCLNHQQHFFNESGWVKQGKEDTWVFFSHWPRFD